EQLRQEDVLEPVGQVRVLDLDVRVLGVPLLDGGVVAEVLAATEGVHVDGDRLGGRVRGGVGGRRLGVAAGGGHRRQGGDQESADGEAALVVRHYRTPLGCGSWEV